MKKATWAARLGAVALLVAAGGLAACKGNRLQDERDALWRQNVEAQEEINRTRAALDAAEMDRARAQQLQAELEAERARRLAAETARAQPQQPQPQPANPWASAAGEGFRDIGGGVEVEQGADRVTVRVPGDVLFASGRTDLRDNAKQTLDRIAGVLQRQYPNDRIRIEGYTDTDPIRRSRWRSNQELSEARAREVRTYLQSKGVDAGRMEAIGRGEANPRETKAQSRRVEIVVLTGR